MIRLPIQLDTHRTNRAPSVVDLLCYFSKQSVCKDIQDKGITLDLKFIIQSFLIRFHQCTPKQPLPWIKIKKQIQLVLLHFFVIIYVQFDTNDIRDSSNFAIVNIPLLDSNLQIVPAYGVNISQRCVWACKLYSDQLQDHRLVSEY